MTPLPVSRFVVRGPVLQARRDAAAIVAAAEADAATLRGQAARDRIAERERGYADGLAAGATDGSRAAQAAALAAAEFLAAREAELTDLAFAIAARVLGALPPDQVMTTIARNAIAEHRAGTRLVLRVAPAMAATMRAALATDAVEIQADPAAPPGTCTLVHPRGSTDLGILDQFRAMMAGRT